MNANLTRRHFILTATSAAGGLMIGIGAAPAIAEAATVVAQPWNEDNAYAANEIDAWIAIDPDDSILIRYQRSEMGQGSMTALPMMITEELHCDWSKVRIEYASPNRNLRENNVYGAMFSNGSRSVRASQKKMQQVGASAPRTPDRGRGRPMERAGVGMHGSIECRHPRSVGTDAALWRTDRGCCEDKARAGTRDQDARQVHLHRQADAAHRRGAQDRRLGQIRHRRAATGHGFRRDQCLSRSGRQTEECR